MIKKKARPIASSELPDELPTRAPGGGPVHRSFVVYGRSGSGKTTFAASFPANVLLLDVKDIGDDSISDVPGLRVRDIATWEDFELTYWWLKKNPGKYKTLAIDTVSQLQQLCIRKVLEDKSKDADRAGDWGVMTKREWGDVAALMKTWILNIRDLPMHTVFIAQDRVFNTGDEDEAKGLEPEVGPALSPSIMRSLNAAVHFIGNSFIRQRMVKVKVKDSKVVKEVERLEYCMRIGPSAYFITKLRKPKSISLPDVMVNPTFDAVNKLMKGIV